ncbi:MAG: outer membrane beta-barrel protein [Bacteroidales bacterium]
MQKCLSTLVFISFLIASTNGNAQLTKIGGGFSLATGGKYIYNDYEYYNGSIGFDIRAEFDINKSIKIVPDFQIFLPTTSEYILGGESKTTLLTLDLNGHFIIASSKKVDFYGIGGLHLGGWNIEDKHTTMIEDEIDNSAFKIDVAANLGAGVEIKITRQLGIFADLKYIVSNSNQLVFTPGLIYEF